MTLGIPYGHDIAPAHLPTGPDDLGLPPGVHPNDPATATDQHAAPPETRTDRYLGRAPWHTPNTNAIAMFQRGSEDWGVASIKLGSAGGVGSGQVQAAGRVPGRTAVILTVPTLDINGVAVGAVLVAPDPGSIEQAQSGGVGDVLLLNPGDSYTLYTEAPVYAGVSIGATNCILQVIQLINQTL
jgi:hypothetical protein